MGASTSAQSPGMNPLCGIYGVGPITSTLVRTHLALRRGVVAAFWPRERKVGGPGATGCRCVKRKWVATATRWAHNTTTAQGWWRTELATPSGSPLPRHLSGDHAKFAPSAPPNFLFQHQTQDVKTSSLSPLLHTHVHCSNRLARSRHLPVEKLPRTASSTQASSSASLLLWTRAAVWSFLDFSNCTMWRDRVSQRVWSARNGVYT